MDAALVPDRIDGHDVGVVQLGGGLGLVLEALQVPRVQGRSERQHLERDDAAQRKLDRLVDDAHAAAADFADDAEIAQRIGGGEIDFAQRETQGRLTGRGTAAGGLVNQLETFQASRQRRLQIGIAVEELGARGGLARFELGEILFDRLDQPGIVGQGRGRVLGGCVATHAELPVSDAAE